MTVKQLIEELKKHNGNAEVFASGYELEVADGERYDRDRYRIEDVCSEFGGGGAVPVVLLAFHPDERVEGGDDGDDSEAASEGTED